MRSRPPGPALLLLPDGQTHTPPCRAEHNPLSGLHSICRKSAETSSAQKFPRITCTVSIARTRLSQLLSRGQCTIVMILFNLLRVERLRKLLIYQIFRYFKKSRSQGLEKGQTEKAELRFMPTILQISKICKHSTLCRPFHTAASNYLVVGSALSSIFTCGRFLCSCEHSKCFWSM